MEGRERSQSRLRAIVEILDGELLIFPIADTDEHRREILDALRFLREVTAAEGL